MNPLYDDFKRAERNREMVRLKQNTIAYLLVETVLRYWPYRNPLPYWMPRGNLLKVGKEETRTLRDYGIHEC